MCLTIKHRSAITVLLSLLLFSSGCRSGASSPGLDDNLHTLDLSAAPEKIKKLYSTMQLSFDYFGRQGRPKKPPKISFYCSVDVEIPLYNCRSQTEKPDATRRESFNYDIWWSPKTLENTKLAAVTIVIEYPSQGPSSLPFTHSFQTIWFFKNNRWIDLEVDNAHQQQSNIGLAGHDLDGLDILAGQWTAGLVQGI